MEVALVLWQSVKGPSEEVVAPSSPYLPGLPGLSGCQLIGSRLYNDMEQLKKPLDQSPCSPISLQDTVDSVAQWTHYHAC